MYIIVLRSSNPYQHVVLVGFHWAKTSQETDDYCIGHTKATPTAGAACMSELQCNELYHMREAWWYLYYCCILFVVGCSFRHLHSSFFWSLSTGHKREYICLAFATGDGIKCGVSSAGYFELRLGTETEREKIRR